MKRREVEKKKHGGWCQKEKRRCRRTGIVADEVEGTNVDLNGEGHHGRVQINNHISQSGRGRWRN